MAHLFTGFLCLFVMSSMVTLVESFAYKRAAAFHPDISNDGRTFIWAVKLVTNSSAIIVDENLADRTAFEVGLVSVGQIGHVADHYLFAHPEFIDITLSFTRVKDELVQIKLATEKRLAEHRSVSWFDEQVFRTRVQRSIHISDPKFSDQWHLKNNISFGMDINVTEIWNHNITGTGITVSVIDDGLEWSNPDLRDNYKEAGSWDLIDGDSDPTPTDGNGKNEHGTRCAGEIAAVSNSVCGVGVAFGASISGIKVLNGKMTDSMEASAFNTNMDVNDIYSCSWGPEDDGKTVDGPHTLAKKAIQHGVDVGRGGYGTIYVVASGNGGLHQDNCNYDGYANSIYTVTIGAVDENGNMPYYAEECASMIAVCFSSGESSQRSIVTTDWTHSNPSGCTAHHTGTSAAAPLAAGIIALMLQVRPCLSWRDIQYLLVLTAAKVDIGHAAWYTNAAGLHHSHKHGFGLLNAWRLVNAAKVWKSVPWKTTFTSELLNVRQDISCHVQNVTLNYNVVSAAMLWPYHLTTLEYVQIRVTVEHSCRGCLEMRIRCPSGSESIIAAPRPKDTSSAGYTGWTFSTVRCWGEDPVGNWMLIITDKGSKGGGTGIFRSWQLILHGTPMTSVEFQDRRKLVKESYSGVFLTNASWSLPCDPPPVSLDTVTPLSIKALKILTITSIFMLVFAVYQSLEYLLCYDQEKATTRERISFRRYPNSTSRSSAADQTPLLEEEESIQMREFISPPPVSRNE